MSSLIIRLRITAILLIVFSVFLCACNDEDDDSASDDQTDDDAADDDAIDDDAIDDDADTSNDDDAGDDDTFSKPPTLRLLITGKTVDELASWVQTNDGWRKLDVPQQGDVGDGRYEEFGPIAIRDGAYGYAAINRYDAYGKAKGLAYWHSTGHSWLTFDLDHGWQANDELAPAGRSSNILHLQAPAPGNLWVGSEFLFAWSDSGAPFAHSFLFSFDDLLHYSGQNKDLEWRVFYQKLTALSVPTENYGLAWVNKVFGDELWIFDGDNWTVGETPAAFEKAHIDWFWLKEPGQGYALGYDDEKTTRRVFEQNDGIWAELMPPAGCEGDMPNYLFATDDYAIGLSDYGYNRKVWEKRDGQWQCRDLSAHVQRWYEIRATITQDARAFVALYISYLNPVLLEIAADSVSKIDLPFGITEILGVHVLGELAAPLSYSPGWF